MSSNIPAEKGPGPAQPVLGCAVCVQAERGGIDRQWLSLRRSGTEFHKSVQVYLPKAPQFPYWVGS